MRKKNIFRTGHLLPKSATCFIKLILMVFSLKLFIFYVISMNNLRHPNRINMSLKDF